jgi:hypothetical protein
MQRPEAHGWMGLAISTWQYLSHLLWQHSPAQYSNAFAVAVISTAFYAAAFGTPALAYANAVVGIWLFSSSWMLPRLAQATLWNNLIVSAAMIGVAAAPHVIGRMQRPRKAHRSVQSEAVTERK